MPTGIEVEKAAGHHEPCQENSLGTGEVANATRNFVLTILNGNISLFLFV